MSKSDLILPDVTDVAWTAAEAVSLPQLEAAMSPALQAIGAEVYVGVEARRVGGQPEVRVVFGRSSPAWQQHYFDQAHAARDPILRHLMTSPDPVFWSDLEGKNLNRDQQQVMSEARAFGLAEGYVSPLHHPTGGVSGVLLMGTDLDGADRRQRACAHLLSTTFAQAARRIRTAEFNRPWRARGALLGRREAECLYWVIRGKTDKSIGLSLGVYQHTVRGYISSAADKLGVSSRKTAAFAASERGLLPLHLAEV